MKLTRGSKHESIERLNRRLAERGYDAGDDDTAFDDNTREAVATFQLEHGLEATGIVDAKTLDELDLDVEHDDEEADRPEREQFRYLLAKNPNYFGTLPTAPFDAVEEFELDTAYEELTCLGYEPGAERLEAVVHVKRQSGYGGDICSSGTPEYVRFYVDWDDDGSWEDVGMASFTAYDIPGEKPLEYGVSLEIDPEEAFCFVENLPPVRAILSWNQPPPPNTPGFTPVWGNVLEERIQIDPLSVIVIDDLLDEFEVAIPDPILSSIEKTSALTLDPQALSLNDLASQYADTNVPARRYGFTEVTALLDAPYLEDDLDDPALFQPLLDLDFDIDIESIIDGILEQSGSTGYEELECVGLTRGGLNATLRLKRPNGYSGSLCTAGSDEYIAFWEWDDATSQWDHLGTTSVNVHDLDDIPGSGLSYAAFLPADLSHRRQPCADGPSTVRIRATLSWEQPPPANDPYWTPVWGNSIETRVHVPPGPVVEGTAGYMDTVGNMAVCDIDQGTGLATGPGVLAGFTARESPFGGWVTVTGFITEPPHILDGEAPMQYRVSVRPYKPGATDADNPWQPLGNEFKITVTERIGSGPPTQHKMTQSADSNGFYTYREDPPPNNWRYVAGRVLARWRTHGTEGKWEVKLETKLPGEDPVPASLIECADGSTRHTVVVNLDNTGPDADIDITEVEHPDGTVDTGDECGKFRVGDIIRGTYSGTDEHFRRLSLGVQPGSHTHGASIVPSSRAYPTVPNTGESGTWELDTDGMDPCGYIARIRVRDRTIVNSGRIGWGAGDSAGFCLEAANPGRGRGRGRDADE